MGLVVRCSNGASLSIVVNSILRAAAEGHPPLIHTAVFDSTGRRDYERDLLDERRAARHGVSRTR